MAGNFDFLHIKRHTAGSSNELSFDVLDQLRDAADGKGGRGAKGPKTPKAPKASQGTYHGVTGTATLSGQAEVQKRKQVRRDYRLRLRVIGVAVAVALVGVGVYFGVRFHDEQADFTGRINALVARLSAVDETLVQVDELMADPFDDEAAAERRAVMAKAPKATTELNRISVDAQSMLRANLGEREEVVVGQLNEAAQARAAMFAAASEAFEFCDEAAEQVKRANDDWNGVLAADQLAREANALANKATTPEATRESLDKTRQARDAFNAALSDLQDISDAYGVDFADQNAYLGKKTEALGYALETSEALLAGNRSTATTANDAYNKADAEAAELAGDLPASIEGVVRAQFERNYTAYQQRYDDARARTIQADSTIRQYLN